MRNYILIVEDNDDDVVVIKRGLLKGKIINTIQRSVNGKEAIEFINDNKVDKIDLILLDLNMEVMNGFDFLKYRQDNPEILKIPTVVLTSSHRFEDIELAYSLGANAYVEKPVDPKLFIDAILSIENFWIQLVKKP